ncbi:uncharacterized protein L201_000785 [Kwoniella dendrophila CBS 6074]|uniref:BTB domain-containing protein n=1 Tax=Kwoniella dendrophila CBS 6074 TaxID=1295534 RepID=A0AAX4JKK2_9TREE
MSVNNVKSRFHPAFTFKHPDQAVLVSDTGLHFAIFKDALSRSSQVFASAVDIPQPTDEAQKVYDHQLEEALSKAIDMETSDTTLKWFIDIFDTTQPVCSLTTSEETFQLTQICQKWDVNDSALKALKDRLPTLIDFPPWKWLALA